MNWQLPILLAQAIPEDYRARVEKTTLPGTTVPDSALVREGGVNVLSTEYWFPEQASSFAGSVDDLYMGIFWISLVFFVGIIAAMLYFVVKYRRKGTEINPLPSPSHSTGIEVLWTVGPSIFLVWMFYEGATGYFEMRGASQADAEEIHVMASRYNWLFTYPDGDSSAELHLVMDRPTRLVLQSKDVLHSLYVPAFRQKMDIVPGRYTYAYIMPTVPGQYRLACAEYCGEGHSRMRTMAEVHVTDADRKSNTQWIKAEHAPWENGERTYKIQCSGCHKIDGTAATGPPLNLLWGKGQEDLVDGAKIKVDAQYIQDSIWFPEKQVVAGYGPVSKMNSFKGQLKEEDVNDMVAYLKHLHDPSLDSQPESPAESPSGEETGDPEASDPPSSETPAKELLDGEEKEVDPPAEELTLSMDDEVEGSKTQESKTDESPADAGSDNTDASDEK